MPYGGYFGGGSDKSKQIFKETGIQGTSFTSPTSGTGKKKAKKKTKKKS